MKAELQWENGMTFATKIRDHTFRQDISRPTGNDLGPTPKEILIAAVLGCTGMDVVALIKKHKIEITSFSLTGNGDPRDHHPRIFTQIDVVFDLKINFTDRETQFPKVLEAVQLSLTKYCSVSAMVSTASPIFYTVVVNGEIEARDQAKFPS